MFNDNQNLIYLGGLTVSLILIGIVKLVASEFCRFRRKQEIADFAQEHGIDFENDRLRSQELVHQRYRDFKLVLDRAAVTFRNLMVVQTDERKLSIFDHGYRKGDHATESRQAANVFQTVLAIEIPQLDLEHTFCLGPEDERDPEMIKHVPQKLMDLIDAHPQYSFEGIRNIVWVYEHGKLQNAQDYSQLLQLGHEVYEAVADSQAVNL